MLTGKYRLEGANVRLHFRRLHITGAQAQGGGGRRKARRREHGTTDVVQTEFIMVNIRFSFAGFFFNDNNNLTMTFSFHQGGVVINDNNNLTMTFSLNQGGVVMSSQIKHTHSHQDTPLSSYT